MNRCFVRPVSTLAAWGKSLFITDPAVVLDPARTWDPCTGAGTQGGVWTFAHLIREMAIGSGRTPEKFVVEWLSNWLNDYAVNTDTVPARTQMFDHRFQRLFELSHCTACTSLFALKVDILDRIKELGPVPIDPGPDSTFPFQIGPVTDLGVVQKILDLRTQFAGVTRSEPVDFIRAVDMTTD